MNQFGQGNFGQPNFENEGNNSQGNMQTPQQQQVPQLYQQNTGHPQQYQQQVPLPQVQPQPQALDFSSEIRKMISTAGTLELTEKQNDILYSSVKDYDVFIKPDGLIYLSWMKYSERLNKAFGGTSWVMLPEGTPKVMQQKNLIIWGFHFVIKGIYSGFAIGEQQYFDNGRMTYGEACEGAKSNALMRLCKNIGIGLELWDKNFIDRWVKTYAVSYQDRDGKTKWKLKSDVQDHFLKLQSQEKAGVQPQAQPQPQPQPQAQTQPQPQVAVQPNDEQPSPSKKRGAGKKKVADDIPIEKITDADLGEKPKAVLNEKTQPYYDSIMGCTSPNQIRPIFEDAKAEKIKGNLTEEEIDIVRTIANEQYVKISSKSV